MSLLDCRISLLFEKLTVPSVTVSECLLDLFYEDKKYRIKYPQDFPTIVTLKSPLKREINTMNLTILIKKGKKYRKLAKGEVNFYKKYLLTESISIEKWVYLLPYRNQLESNVQSGEETPGEIYLKAQFIDPEQPNTNKVFFNKMNLYGSNVSSVTKMLKNVISNLPAKEKDAYKQKKVLISNDTLALLHLTNLAGKLDDDDILRLKATKETKIEDDLSDVSVSIIEDNDDHNQEIDKVNYQVDDMITKLRKFFDENSESVLPSDPDQLRTLLENLTTQVKTISETYSQNLQSMSSINKRLKFQAKDYYDRYKELKKTFDKERKEFQSKSKVLQCEEQLNKDENIKIGKELSEVKNEIDYFQSKLGLTSDQKDDETEIMIDILKSLKEKGVDITEGLSKDQIEFLNEVMNNNNKQDKANQSSDSIEGEKYAKAIEEVANRNYNKNLIPEIKIEQIETNVYSFNDKEVCLMFGNDQKLKLSNGNDFEQWIIDNFRIQPVKQAVSNTTTTNNNSKNVKKPINGKNGRK